MLTECSQIYSTILSGAATEHPIVARSICAGNSQTPSHQPQLQGKVRVCIVGAGVALSSCGTSLGGVPREQKMLKGHLPRVIYQRAYCHMKIKHVCAYRQRDMPAKLCPSHWTCLHDVWHIANRSIRAPQAPMRTSYTTLHCRRASERKQNNLKGFLDFYLKAQARIWP